MGVFGMFSRQLWYSGDVEASRGGGGYSRFRIVGREFDFALVGGFE